MTMADTVAVMNGGVIEQLGEPVALYEAPRTTFVANFLGQSNLVSARRRGTDGDLVLADCHGQTVGVPTDRLSATEDAFLVGVRPEKIHLTEPGAGEPGQNRLTGGVVVDASFSGVSTQYLVRMPWDSELMVFAQNTGVGQRFAAGAPVDLTWERGHTFGLPADGAAAPPDDAPAPDESADRPAAVTG